jgi:PAS domain-containing protein
VAIGKVGLSELPDAVRSVPGQHGIVLLVLWEGAIAVVLGAVSMRLLGNPVILQLVGLGLLIGATAVIGFLLVRGMRKNIMEEMSPISDKTRPEAPSFAMAAYQGVITNLKQRETELKAQLTRESNRIDILETVSNSVLENIPTGVVMFSSNLLVQQANAAARSLLGYASPLNMHVKEVFRGLQTVELPSTNGALGGIGQAIRDVFAKRAEYRGVPAKYSTPSGESREFQIALLPIGTVGREVTSAMCLIDAFGTAFTLSFPPLEAGKKAEEPE